MWRIRREKDRSEGEVVAAASAFLNGTAAQHLRSGRGAVPAWAWLNLLAHGSALQVTNTACGLSHDLPRSTGARRWRHAIRFLANQMLEASGGRLEVLERIQRNALQPLEERMLRRDSGAPGTPEQMVAAALVAMACVPGPQGPQNRASS